MYGEQTFAQLRTGLRVDTEFRLLQSGNMVLPQLLVSTVFASDDHRNASFLKTTLKEFNNKNVVTINFFFHFQQVETLHRKQWLMAQSHHK